MVKCMLQSASALIAESADLLRDMYMPRQVDLHNPMSMHKHGLALAESTDLLPDMTMQPVPLKHWEPKQIE